MKVEQELDFYCLYGLADQDGPLRNEVRIGLSKMGALAGEIYTAKTWRSVPVATVTEVYVKGRPLGERFRKSIATRLAQLNVPRREGWWWLIPPSTFSGIVSEVVDLEQIAARTKADVDREFNEALRRQMRGVMR